MLLTIIVSLLILGIVFFQATQGLFSSLIMAIATLVCTLIAFNFYEPVASLLYGSQPETADAIALVALLFVSLLTTRILLDRFLGINLVPGIWVDRIGGGLFGVVTAVLLVGTLVVAAQMLPLDRAILGYDPFNDDLEPNRIRINASTFTLGAVETLSRGSLSAIGAENSFERMHSNLQLELWGTRNRVPGQRTDAPPDSAKLLGVYDATTIAYPGSARTFGQEAPAYPGGPTDLEKSQVVVVRLGLTDPARNAKDGRWHIPGTQCRLVAEDGASFYPVGYLTFGGQWQMLTDKIGKIVINRTRESNPGEITIDLVYRVSFDPQLNKPRKLAMLAFRRQVHLALTEPQAGMPDPKLALTRIKVTGSVPVIVPSGAINAPLFFLPERASVENTLPGITFNIATTGGQITSVGGVDAMVENIQLAQGKIAGNEATLAEMKAENTVRTFAVPPGQRAVQLKGKAPQSGAVQTLNVSTLMQPSVQITTPEGKQTTLAAAGAWVRWKEAAATPPSATGNFVHLYYKPQQASQTAVMLDPELVDAYKSHLSTTTEFGLIFLVPERSIIQGFRLSNAGETIACESPLETN